MRNLSYKIRKTIAAIFDKEIDQLSGKMVDDFWKKNDLVRYKNKNNRLSKEMTKRCKGLSCVRGRKEPYCPRCEVKDWKHTTARDEHDTYHEMKCKNCNFTWSLTH